MKPITREMSRRDAAALMTNGELRTGIAITPDSFRKALYEETLRRRFVRDLEIARQS